MRRSVKAASRSVEEVMHAVSIGWRPWFVTLTYRPGVEWSPGHISTFLDCVRKWAARRAVALAYVWVAELQRRGAVHYHVVMWVPKGVSLPKPDKQGWWRCGMSQTERARRPMSYLLKYTSKGDLGSFPKGLRLCGFGGLSPDARVVRSWMCLPTWLVARCDVMQRFKRAPGGFWIGADTGEVFLSPWRFVRVDPGGHGELPHLVFERVA